MRPGGNSREGDSRRGYARPPDPEEPPGSPLRALWGEYRVPILVGILVVGAAALLIAVSLRRPAITTYVPTGSAPRPVGDTLVGAVTYTVDASAPDRWRFFDFSRGSVVDDPGPREWDLAFRRFHVVANGGEGFPGRGGIVDLGPVPFDSVEAVPAEGYLGSRAAGDTTHPATEDWYRYSFTSHVLRPKGRTYAVRTADGRYAKVEILGYYCPGARPGCLTFRYAYQGDGSRRVAPAPGDR